MNTKTENRKITVTALFCAMAYLMTFIFHFRVSFLTLDFKDAILAINALLFGPVYGFISAVSVAVLETLTFGGDTQVYGLIMNIISSGTFVLVCGSIYKYRRTFGGAVVGIILSVLAVTGVMMIANIFITPYYMGVPSGEIIKIIPKLLLPFNLCKSAINAAVAMILYKPMTNVLRKAGLLVGEKAARHNVKSLVMVCVSIIVIILSVLCLVLYLEGAFFVTR